MNCAWKTSAITLVAFGVAGATTALARAEGTVPPCRHIGTATAPYRATIDDSVLLAAPFRSPESRSVADKPYAKEVEHAACRENLDPALLHAVIEVESRYNAGALSPKGAVGLMQVLPATGARFGYRNVSTIDNNLRAGAHYLRFLMDTFDQRLDLALAAYNAGEEAVIRHGKRIPPYAETREYVPNVLSRFDKATQTQASPKAYLPGTRLNADWQRRVAAPEPPAMPSPAAQD
jgi:soluble lytic murein transglycosylase-like protein